MVKIAHWSMINNSGMCTVAKSFVQAEGKLGIDSWLVDIADPNGYADILDADIHVVHTHLPDDVRKRLTKPLKTVWVGHGSPEHIFQTSVEQGVSRGYGAGDSWMLAQYWMQNADALVTFWPRQQAIWQSLCDKRTIIDCLPMGIETDFWHPVPSQGKYSGVPSLFTAENGHYCKWPLDLFLCWPWVWPEIPTANLHAVYMPTDQHKWWYPLINRNGTAFKAVTSSTILSKEALRNAFCSTDYFIGLVRYGDFNRISMEANACGARTISYVGNKYADFWIREGDQRTMARDLLSILQGDVKPKKKLPVVDIMETARGMVSIYERIL